MASLYDAASRHEREVSRDATYALLQSLSSAALLEQLLDGGAAEGLFFSLSALDPGLWLGGER